MRRSWMALALFLGACGSHEGPAAPSRSLLPLTVGGVTLVAADPQPGSVLPLQACGRDDCLEIVFTFLRAAETPGACHVELFLVDPWGLAGTASLDVPVR